MKRILFIFLFTLSVITAAVALNTLFAKEAQAITCGATTCSVDSSAVYVGSATPGSGGAIGNPGGGGTGGGSGGGGTGGTPRTVSTTVRCTSWLSSTFYDDGNGSYNGSGKYPRSDRAGTFSCRFGVSQGSADINVICAPKNNRASNGRVDTYEILENGSRGNLLRSYCLYPVDSVFYPKVSSFLRPTGGQGDFYRAPSASSAQAYSSAGRLTDSTGYRRTSFNAANPAAPSDLNQSFNAKTGTINNLPDYGYYRLTWKVDYVVYNETVFPSWQGYPAKYDFVRSGTQTSVEPYTYACNFNPALRSGIAGGAQFTPSACQPNTWRCDVSGNITINGSDKAMTVMRNNSQLAVVFPSFGVSGSGIKDLRNVKSYTNVDTGNVSPLNPATSDPNAAKQYFDASWTWNSWQNYSKTGWISFLWSSDNQKTFTFNQKYRFTADFLVPTQGSINSGTTYSWVTDTTECGGTKNAPRVTVNRSTNS